jgi:hypothetical protein
MAAATVRRLPGAGWVFEPKFDGFRALAFCHGDGVVLQSHQQRPLSDAFPDITTTLAPLTEHQVVLDGEIVVWRAGRLDFAALQDRLRSGPARVRELAAAAPAAYVVFDLLAHRGTDLRDHPYRTRAGEAAPHGAAGRGGAHPHHHRPRRRPHLAGRAHHLRNRGRRRQAGRPALPARGTRLAETPDPAHW